MSHFKHRLIIAGIFALIYGVLMGLFVGWRSDHTFMFGLVLIMMMTHKETYKIVLALSGFALFWIIYDALRIAPNYRFNDVHIKEPYDIELALFGILDAGKYIVPCEWFLTRINDTASLIAGFSYILWMPAPMVYAIYLLWKDRSTLFDFSYGFLLTCFIGFFFYYAYPAAPPWYYLNHGVGTDFSIPGSEGLLSEFDRILGVSIFNGIYAKGGNVFCAIPSLHSAYPMLCLLTALRRKTYYLAFVFLLWGFGTWFAAVYSQHHYVIDVLMGIMCATLGHFLIIRIQRFSFISAFKSWYLKELSL